MQISEPTLEIGDTAAQLLANSPVTPTPVVSGSVLVRLCGHSIAQTLNASLNTNPGQPGEGEAIKVLSLIAETDEDETAREAARGVIG